MRATIVTGDGVKPKVRLLKTLIAVWVLQAAVMASAQWPMLITPTNTTWRYFTNGTDPGTEWALPGFDDSAWPQGQGLFGNDTGYPYGFNTSIPSPGRGGPLTSYYRTHFTWTGWPFGIILTGTNYVDDGCVVYLNGVEITRFNMPAGTPDYDTLAPAANPGGFPNLTSGEPVRVLMQISLDSLTNGNPNPLTNGDNVLAVEVHNNATGSSDTVFGMSLVAWICHAACPDGISPTNRTILEGRSTTFVVNTGLCLPTATFQWYRNVGAGEELIPGATSSTYTLSNAVAALDQGVYYCRLTTFCGTADSRQAVLIIFVDDEPPRFLSASVVGPGLNTFRLTTDEPLCADWQACGTTFTNVFNWQILQSDNPSMDLVVTNVTQVKLTTYEFITSFARDPAKQYQITVTPLFGEIGDLFGNWVPPGTFAETYPTLVFAQGFAGYTGTEDTEIHSQAFADTRLGTSTVMRADLDDAGIAQGLLRFDNLFGFGTNRIPPATRIISATLTLNQIDPGSAVNLHRMLVPWDQTTVTWNSLVDGVTANDVEATTVIDASKPTGLPNGRIDLDVTASIQAWVNGQPNFGWALLCTGADGWTVNTSESGASIAPLLTVAFQSFIEYCLPTFNTQPPAALSVNEGSPFVIAVGLSNFCAGTLQWTKDNVDILGANAIAYSVARAALGDAGTYRLRVIGPAGTVTSSPCVVSVVLETNRPHVTRVANSANGTTVTVTFNEGVNPASAQNTANYSLSPAVDVSSATLGSNNTVTLTTAPRGVGTHYALRIANVTDAAAAANPIDPNPTIVSLTSASLVTNAGWTDIWHYNTNNLDATPDWKNPGFTPGADWGIGGGLFGLEASAAVLAVAPAPIATPLPVNNVAANSERLVTTYFRRMIDLPALPAGARYVICHYADDGFIAYLDGAEIYRFAMPSGAVTFTNRSTGIPTAEATYRSFSLNATPGIHTLAVELHQAGVTSSDVLFGMEVRIVDGSAPSLSITHSPNGSVNLNWNADGNWRLRSAAAVSGPYLDVAIPVNNRLGTFSLPAASTINRAFWLLDYTGHP